MRAGRMRDRVTFQRLDNTTDQYAQVTAASYTNILTVWGELVTGKGREAMEAGRLQSEVRSVLHVRSSSEVRGVTESDRALIGGVAYNIRAISNPDRRNHRLEMILERGVG